MSRERFYSFTLSNGETRVISIKEAIELNDPMVNARIKNIIENSKTKRMKKDGFEPGWQENIQAYAGGRLEYNRLLKEKGLQEIGYDYIPQDITNWRNPCHSEEFALAVKEVFKDVSDNEMRAIATGEYFDKSNSGTTDQD